MEVKSITRALKASPLLTLVFATLILTGSGIAVSRYLLTIQSTIDITIEPNPYTLSLIRDSVPVTDINFIGTVYEDDLKGQDFNSTSYYLITITGHTQAIYGYIEIDGLTEQTINIYNKPNGDWELFDQLTSENPITMTPLVFEPGKDLINLKFGITEVYANTSLNTLTVNFYGEDAIRP